MKYVFISLPMSGKTDKEIGHRLCSINGAVKAACASKFGWDWDEIKTIDNFWDHDEIDNNTDMPVQEPRVFYLGGALQKMSRADAIYFDEGWEESEGCRIEFCVCQEYNIPFMLFDDLLDTKGDKKDEEKEE